ncbi:rRNA maturation RNase YbeY [Paucihalobacter sp.]|uniref:rRNA maturation RNase YbeY n=1 Tax=Paucihalobacter sp. TaxID=2850405 RepID=UPI002FE2D574
MINFYYETDFKLRNEKTVSEWIAIAIIDEEKTEGELNFIFVDDDYLHKLNVEFLQHDTLTDIITFDNSIGNILHSDIYISVQRVADNAKDFESNFNEELSRVMIHGILHLCGYKDKGINDTELMRSKENYYLSKMV